MTRPTTTFLTVATLSLGVLAGPAAAFNDRTQPRQISVVTSEYRFAPKTLRLKRGLAYRLHLENRGKETHEFTAPDFFKAIDLADASVLNADRTEIVLQPGDSKELRFVATKAGRYKLRCSDHDWAGMTGRIVIE